MAGGSREQDKQVKVTIIETQFVKTDEANFKSVVHQFTGKDSMVAMAPRTLLTRPQARRAVPTMAQSQMAVPNTSRESEAQRAVPTMAQSQMEVPNASMESEVVTPQNGMANRDGAFMEDLEPLLEEFYKFIDP
ncbi:VQ motif-containing protein 10 [Carex littledalei]|uniref:VQ motif-containing protein 10 n=1 Tax=Carex littledalei TaxID=544730 RepID=A0A833VJ53_9POAL|nr:VQ motif-containing protein 10 [Carex littledalei]